MNYWGNETTGSWPMYWRCLKILNIEKANTVFAKDRWYSCKSSIFELYEDFGRMSVKDAPFHCHCRLSIDGATRKFWFSWKHCVYIINSRSCNYALNQIRRKEISDKVLFAEFNDLSSAYLLFVNFALANMYIFGVLLTLIRKVDFMKCS